MTAVRAPEEVDHRIRRGPPPWIAVSAAVFVCCWGGNQFSPLLLMYEERAHYSSVIANGLLGIYVIGLIPALLIAGAMSDGRGRRPLMLAGVVATIVGSALLAFGPVGLGFLAGGRLLSGVGVGVAMAVGTSWLTELSRAPYDPRSDDGAGARRSAVAFGTGSACGALVAGLFAQWGPHPETLPFVVHIVLGLPVLAAVARVPETRARAVGARDVAARDAAATRGSLRSRLDLPGIRHRRFIRIVMIASPWIFGAAGIGYAYLPTQLSATGSHGLLFATAASIIALATSSAVQPLARWIHSDTSARGLMVAIGGLALGLALVTVSIAIQSIPLGLIANVAVGFGIGIGQVSGLLEVQRIARRGELAALTGVFYSLAYLGFLFPVIIAALAVHVAVVGILWTLVGLAVITGALVAVSSRRHLPVRAVGPGEDASVRTSHSRL